MVRGPDDTANHICGAYEGSTSRRLFRPRRCVQRRLELRCHVQYPFIAQDRPSRSCSPTQPQCSLAQKGVGGCQGKVSPGGARRCANPVHGGRRRRGRGALRFPSDRTRASRAKVSSFAHQATLPNEDYHTEKSVLFPKKDRLDGFRAKRAITALR